jgi:hypothetical protein
VYRFGTTFLKVVKYIMNQTTGLKRTTIDKYYTKPEIAELCISHIKTHISIQPTDLIIQPLKVF